jgi:hypothetical protein
MGLSQPIQSQPISEFKRDATSPGVRPMGVLPVPKDSSAMQFWRFSIHSRRASPRTSALLSDGWALKNRAARMPDLLEPLPVPSLVGARDVSESRSSVDDDPPMVTEVRAVYRSSCIDPRESYKVDRVGVREEQRGIE